MLQNEYLDAKIGVDPAENEPSKAHRGSSDMTLDPATDVLLRALSILQGFPWRGSHKAFEF